MYKRIIKCTYSEWKELVVVRENTKINKPPSKMNHHVLCADKLDDNKLLTDRISINWPTYQWQYSIHMTSLNYSFVLLLLLFDWPILIVVWRLYLFFFVIIVCCCCRYYFLWFFGRYKQYCTDMHACCAHL